MVDDGPGPTSKNRHVVGDEIQGPSGDGRDRVGGGDSASNDSLGYVSGSCVVAKEDGPGLASRDCDYACGRGTPHVNAALGGEFAEMWSWPA